VNANVREPSSQRGASPPPIVNVRDEFGPFVN